jgi:hypothetical protein
VHIKCSRWKPQSVIPEIHEKSLAPCYPKTFIALITDMTAPYLDECPIFKCQAVFLKFTFCLETSLTNHQHILRNISEQHMHMHKTIVAHTGEWDSGN